MPITVSGTSITFNDATVQTTAGGPYTGARGQVFTGNGTFTIPTGVTTVKVTVVGGGGGGGGYNPGCSGNPTTGGTGGTSSVSSGNQTISTVSATGGQGSSPSAILSPGSGSGGDLNIAMRQGNWVSWGGGFTFGGGGSGFATPPGEGGGSAVRWFTGLTPGANLTVTRGGGGGGTGQGATGQNGVIYFEW